MRWLLFLPLLVFSPTLSNAQNVAYIHGDVAADGTTPSGAAEPYDQMLLNDTGRTGLTEFRDMVIAQGYTITDHYDQTTTLSPAFLNPFDVIVFGLHQTIWSANEKAALDTWLRQGGGMLIYSDSASGGRFNVVGINNPVGKNVTNNLISRYGLEVTVDLGGGTRSYQPEPGSPNPIIWDQPVFEGEGVSPVAVDLTSGAEVLIPLAPENRVGGNGTLNIPANATDIANPAYAAMALQTVGRGHIIAIFDRQPMWNDGPGSDIDGRDNREVLRRTIRFLARDYGNADDWTELDGAPAISREPFELSWRQWAGGTGTVGSGYVARNNRVRLEFSPTLDPPSWTSDGSLITLLDRVDNQDETETVTVQLAIPQAGTERLFARLARQPTNTPTPEALVVDAGEDRLIGETGRVSLEGSVRGGDGNATLAWRQVAGPGSASFADASAVTTTATFTQPGTYELELTANNPAGAESDRIEVRVVSDSDVVRAINCAGGAFDGQNGFGYAADAFFAPANSITDNFPNNAVSGTEDDALYNTARSRFDTYTIPIPNGTYTVYLQFAETFWTDANKRVFDLSIEGDLILDDLDLVAVAAGRWIALDRAIATTITDGDLVISATASMNNSLLNAFVIIAE